MVSLEERVKKLELELIEAKLERLKEIRKRKSVEEDLRDVNKKMAFLIQHVHSTSRELNEGKVDNEYEEFEDDNDGVNGEEGVDQTSATSESVMEEKCETDIDSEECQDTRDSPRKFPQNFSPKKRKVILQAQRSSPHKECRRSTPTKTTESMPTMRVPSPTVKEPVVKAPTVKLPSVKLPMMKLSNDSLMALAKKRDEVSNLRTFSVPTAKITDSGHELSSIQKYELMGCKYCNEKFLFKVKNKFLIHQEKNHPHRCQQTNCDQRFVTIIGQYRHAIKDHQDVDTVCKVKKCTTCDLLIDIKSEKNHMRASHQYGCPSCPLVFTSKMDQRSHYIQAHILKL